jgi:hypothetical protein
VGFGVVMGSLVVLFSASSVVTQVGLEENRRKRGRSAFQRRA